MNLTAIPPDALDRFRHVAALRTQNVNLRASRLLILKGEIATLREHGISYRSISDLLTQSGIPTSNVSVMKFCHRFLNEKRARKSPAKRCGVNRANRGSLLKAAPAIPAKTAPKESASFASRGPRIAKIEQLPPGETI